MAKPGPKSAPTALRLVRKDRKDRINDDEPLPPEGEPECPDEADDAVQVIWDYTMEQLRVMGIATRADRDMLYAYCEAVVLHREASRILAAEGSVVDGLHGGAVKHPAFQIQREAATTMRHIASEFGLTPSSRSGIRKQTAGTVAPPSTDAGGAARLLSG